MRGCSPISTCAKSVIYFRGKVGNHLSGAVSQSLSTSCSYGFYSGESKFKFTSLSVSKTVSTPVIAFQAFQHCCLGPCLSKQRANYQSFATNGSGGGRGPPKKQLEYFFACKNINMRLSLPKQGMVPNIRCKVGRVSWPQGCASACFIFSLLVCSSSSEPVNAEASEDKEDEHELLGVNVCHGKKVYTDYSIIGIPGDGRCLFRSVAHGSCLRAGQPIPRENLQRQLADDLRARVADEFIKRREETEWFVEGDFDAYVAHMRKPHVWGGEPELLMSSHVLKMPISVYMHDEKGGGLICIAEYGQEYGKEDPIRVLYHGFGHYDALRIPGRKGDQSKL